MLQLTFNPGLTLTGFRTTGPRSTTEAHEKHTRSTREAHEKHTTSTRQAHDKHTSTEVL